jgi:hypothetical protein
MMPQLIRISVRRPQRRPIRLWIPLLPLLLVLSPVLVIALVVGSVACVVYRINPVRTLVAGWRLLCGLPGTRVDVDHPEAAVVVAIS